MDEIIKMPYEVISEESQIIIDADKIPTDEVKRILRVFSRAGNIGLKIKKTIDQESDYILKIPKDIKQGIDKGIYWFNEKKEGGGILPDVWGFSEEGKKRVKERLTVEKGVKDYTSLSDSLQSYATQQQLAEMAEDLKNVLELVERIDAGMTADRFAEIEGACDLLEDAKLMENPENRRDTILEAVSKLTIGSKKLEKQIKMRLEKFDKIPDKSFKIWSKMIFSINYVKSIDKNADAIDEYFGYYEKSMILLAYSYMMLEEEKSMERTFKRFTTTIHGFDLENYQSIQNLHPNLCLEDKWFMRQFDYGDTLPDKIKKIDIRESDYITLRISGNQFQEVI